MRRWVVLVLLVGLLGGWMPRGTGVVQLATVVNPTANKVFQRDTITAGSFSVGVGAVSFSITTNFSAPANTLSFQVRDASSPATVLAGPLSVTHGTITSGTPITISPNVPAGLKQYLIDFIYQGGIVGSGTTAFSVGEVVAVGGQSMAADWIQPFNSNGGTVSLSTLGYTAPGSGSGIPLSANAWVVGAWTTNNIPPAWGSESLSQSGSAPTVTPYYGSFPAELCRLVGTSFGVACAVTGFAYNGDTITNWVPVVSAPQFATWKTIMLANVPKAGTIIWYQGDMDAFNGMSKATYQTNVTALITGAGGMTSVVAAPTGAPWNGSSIILVNGVRGADGTATQSTAAQKLEAIRLAGLAYVAGVAASNYIGFLDVDPLTSDNTHAAQSANVQVAREVYRAIGARLGILNTSLGPTITSAARSGATIILTISNAGSGLRLWNNTNTSASSQPVWTQVTGGSVSTPLAAQFQVYTSPTVYSGGAPQGQITVLSAALTNATTITLTLASSPGAAVDVWYRGAPDASLSGVVAYAITDNITDSDGITPGRQLQIGPTRPVTSN